MILWKKEWENYLVNLALDNIEGQFTEQIFAVFKAYLDGQSTTQNLISTLPFIRGDHKGL